MIGSDSLAQELRDARFDDAIKAVVLRIDSPGGSTFASEVIRREVEALRLAGKPVVASMSSLAASGGYYIAMDADRIVASPATLTGSIGIFAMFPTFQRSLERLGVHVDGVGTTALSGEFRPDRPMGEATREILQQSIEYEYAHFIGRVAKSRKQEIAAIDAIAQGRVWSGADAKRLGLVDQLGSYQDAIDLAAKLAKLGKKFDVEYFDAEMGIGEALGLRVQTAAARMVAPLLPRQSVALLPRGAAQRAPRVARTAAHRAPERSAQRLCVLHGLLDRFLGHSPISDDGNSRVSVYRSNSYGSAQPGSVLIRSSHFTTFGQRASSRPAWSGQYRYAQHAMSTIVIAESIKNGRVVSSDPAGRDRCRPAFSSQSVTSGCVRPAAYERAARRFGTESPTRLASQNNHSVSCSRGNSPPSLPLRSAM